MLRCQGRSTRAKTKTTHDCECYDLFSRAQQQCTSHFEPSQHANQMSKRRKSHKKSL